MSDLSNVVRLSASPKRERTAACSVQRFNAFQHEIVAAIQKTYPQAQTLRWRERTLDAFSGAEEIEGVEDDFRALLMGVGYIPDAFVVDRDEMRLDFFEVEVTSPMSIHKLRSYGRLVTDLHYYGIAFEVYTVNQHGHVNQVDLFPHYLSWLAEAQKEAQGAKHE